MAKVHGKKYNELAKKIDKKLSHEPISGFALIKQLNPSKFDASVELAIHLKLDTKQADQQLRGAVTLPNGTGKTKKILALTTTQQDQAKKAGADFVGAQDFIDKIKKENWFDFDVIVATPEIMPKLARIGKILGPKGLMPNPKTNTVTNDIENTVKNVKNGQVSYRTDKTGNIHLVIGKVSFDKEKLLENYNTVIQLILKSRPASVKGQYIQNIAICTSMGPSIKLIAPLY